MSAICHSQTFITLGRIATWLCVLVIVVVSLVPGEDRPHTFLGGHGEHFLAYAGTGLIATLSYRRPGWTIGGLCVLGSAMELLQNLVPDRIPAIMDAVYSTAGAASGAIVALTLIAMARR